jgi:hypothetical protein
MGLTHRKALARSNAEQLPHHARLTSLVRARERIGTANDNVVPKLCVGAHPPSGHSAFSKLQSLHVECPESLDPG